ncbi:ABC transporter ATP-binding protein [Bradyrhizobium prioriisuperbiae]|uniref:ABC transporter ATP-binding protein n=1 Tax=Bradyrhizobium prioriisuperbiae TaxID=2854389 RepID=UPI0028E6FA79|nr:ABC transporter ATP-binding protein [Bradyrhizobium prioritasuperba]
MAQVDLKNVSGRYGEFLAVDDVSLTIQSGQFVTLLGPSGCGKSSTLRIIAGLLTPSSGRVLFDGRDVTGLTAARRNIGMVFQSLALFPHMTVAENVAFGLKMKKTPPADVARCVRRMLEIVRLDHLAGRYPAQMSGGQQQRVALARALAITPSILILDEPFGALDRKLREAMQVELHALTRELGITALFVTHDQEEALMLSDMIAVMNNGAVEQFGPPEEIYKMPRTQFVADFMGVTNFLDGQLVKVSGDGSQVKIGGAILVGPGRTGFNAGDKVKLAVRPEKIVMTTERPADACAGALSGAVKIVTYHGDSSRYVLALETGDTLVAIELTDRRGSTLDPGVPVWASWQDSDVHLFRA